MDKVPAYHGAQSHTLTHTNTHYGQLKDASQSTRCVFGVVKEKGEREREHANIMHTEWRQESILNPRGVKERPLIQLHFTFY